MDIIQGGKKTLLLDIKSGDLALVFLITGKIEKVMLNNVTKLGIEAFEVNLSSQPLTFYPYSAIIKIKKYSEIDKEG